MRALLGAVDAGCTVLAPTAEIAAAIQSRIEMHFADGGRDVWATPQIRDFSGWIRQQYERQQFGFARAPRILSEVEERQIWRDVIARSEIAEEFSDTGGAARSARRACRAMHEYGIPAAALASFPSAETTALSSWLGDFDGRCRSLNAISAGQILYSLAEPDERPTWIESPAWHPQALQWLRRHARDPLLPQAVDAAASSRRSESVRLCSSFAEEIAACAEWAGAKRRANPGFRAWIHIAELGAKRAQVADAFDSALVPARYGTREYLRAPAYAISGGTPLSGFEPVRTALHSLSGACEALPFARFSALLRAPALQASDADAVCAARLDEALRGRAPSQATLNAWLVLSARIAAAKGLERVSALVRLQAVDDALNGVRSSFKLSQWAPIWIKAFDAGPWAGRASWSSAAYQAAERLRALIGALACADEIYGSLSKSAAVHALTMAAGETVFQVQTGVAPVWVTGQAADPWLPYDGIWVTSSAADVWPPAAAPLPLIPVQLQKQHRVAGATAALQLERSVDLQRRWIERCAGIVFSCSNETGTPAVPSALLPPSIRIEGGSGVIKDPLIHNLRAAATALETFYDAAGPAFTTEEKTRGTASLREQSLCAFRGFAMTRLRSERLEMPTPGFNDMERGVLLHAALEFIWNRLGDSEKLSASADAELAALIEAGVDRAIRDALVKRDPGRHWSVREARRLQRLLPVWLRVESEREPFEILELESARRGVRFGGLEFDVRIDRIDRLPDGTLVLIDYKSGAVKPDWEGDRPGNPQLPIYALSVDAPVTAVAYAQIQARTCKFAGIADRDGVLPRVRAGRGESAGGMAAALALWSVRIERIAEELRRGAAQVAPLPAACRSCHLQGFCRISSVGGADGADDAGEASDAL